MPAEIKQLWDDAGRMLGVNHKRRSEEEEMDSDAVVVTHLRNALKATVEAREGVIWRIQNHTNRLVEESASLKKWVEDEHALRAAIASYGLPKGIHREVE